MALTVVWEKMAVSNADGHETIINRGEALPDYVSDFHRTVYTMIGAVKDTGAPIAIVERAAEEEFADPPAPAQHPAEVPPVVPTPTGTAPAPAQPDLPPAKPATGDNKDAWEAYAVARGYMSQTEAEGLTKTKLIAAVNERETAR